MARPLRIAVAGGLYHLITRGNAREHIYLDDLDREIFLDRLAHSVERYGWLCHAYCLMDNHYHLLVETPQPNLSIGMRQLNGLYAQTFNSRHDRCGHVFQARFRSIFVEKDSHLLSCCRYLVLNPVRAGVCEHPEQYRWSSYRATAGTAGREEFLTTDWLLRLFAPTRKLAQHGYSAFVAAGIPEARDQAVRGNAWAASSSCATDSATTHQSRRSRGNRSSRCLHHSKRSSPHTQRRSPSRTGGTVTPSERSPTTSAVTTRRLAAASAPKKPPYVDARPDPRTAAQCRSGSQRMVKRAFRLAVITRPKHARGEDGRLHGRQRMR
jgi:REP element-mobilizing transposase RayT